MKRLALIHLLVCGILGRELGEQGGTRSEEQNYHQDEQDRNDQHLKGDPGTVRVESLQRIRRDTAEDLAQMLSSSTNMFPFAPPAQTYFMGQCLMCPPGGPGPRGPPGLPGRDGRDGRDQTLLTWPTERERNPGTEEEREVPVVANHTNVGVTYPRWGKTTCPPSSQIVYEGVMAGGHFNYKGGGSNYLCLPLEPIFDRPQSGNDFGAYIYGAEYQFSNFAAMPDINNHDIPCVVCLVLAKHHVLMLPGRNICPEQQGWILEYSGYLMAHHVHHYRSEYICVDKSAEGIPRTSHNDDQVIPRPVEAQCSSNGGGLPCPPYVSGYELTCAVCTL